nr:ATP-binding protein [Streptomyces sp. NRRL S-455]
MADLGVAEPLLPVIRTNTTEDQLLGLVEYAPQLTGEVLLALFDGASYEDVLDQVTRPVAATEPVDPDDFEAAAQRPGSREARGPRTPASARRPNTVPQVGVSAPAGLLGHVVRVWVRHGDEVADRLSMLRQPISRYGAKLKARADMVGSPERIRTGEDRRWGLLRNQEPASARAQFAQCVQDLITASGLTRGEFASRAAQVERTLPDPPGRVPVFNEERLGEWCAREHVPDQRVVDTLVHTAVRARRERGLSPLGVGPHVLSIDRCRELRQRAQEERATVDSAPSLTPEVVPARLGCALDQLDPVRHLQVHRAIEVDRRTPSTDGLGQLPQYVRRAHDRRLQDEVALAVAGQSRLVVLVGDSSTGKSRALWEAVTRLPAGWLVWRPSDRTDLLQGLRSQHRLSHTVLWLNELERYLLPHGQPDPGGRAASALMSLMHDAGRGPVLVLGTLWHRHHTTLTQRPSGSQQHDPHQQARTLLDDSTLTVAECFTPEDLSTLQGLAADDPRLAEALAKGDSRITQYLAGARELVARYEEKASPHIRAVLDAAADARRLGHGELLPEVFLRAAAGSYLHRDYWRTQTSQWRQTWFERAVHATDQACRGIPGPLTQEVAPPGQPNCVEPLYRLADYLQAHTARTRGGKCPPTGFWDAAAVHLTEPAVLMSFARAAHQRERLQIADRLYQAAVEYGHNDALHDLALLREEVGDHGGADGFALRSVRHGSGRAVSEVAEMREDADDRRGAERLYVKAAQVGDTWALCCLARLRREAGDWAEAEHYAQQAAALGDTRAWLELATLTDDLGSAERFALMAADQGDTLVLRTLAQQHETTDPKQAERLYRSAGDRGDGEALRRLATMRQQSGDGGGAQKLYHEAADLGDTEAMRKLALRYHEAGDAQAADRMYRRAAEHGDMLALGLLASRRERAGDREGAERCAREAAGQGATEAVWLFVQEREMGGDARGAEDYAYRCAREGNATILWYLAQRREWMGDREGAERLYRWLISRGERSGVLGLLRLREWDGDREGAEAYAFQAAGRGHPEALRLLFQLRQAAGAEKDAERLAHEAADRGDTALLLSTASRREESGDGKGAERLYRMAADRGDVQALLALGRLREAVGDRDAADELYGQAAEGGYRWDVHLLALGREGDGDREGALRLYRRLVDDGDPWPLGCLARIQEADGDSEGAERLYRRAADYGEVPSEIARQRWPFGLDASGEPVERWW